MTPFPGVFVGESEVLLGSSSSFSCVLLSSSSSSSLPESVGRCVSSGIVSREFSCNFSGVVLVLVSN